jgi:toxin ParE1/3/4
MQLEIAPRVREDLQEIARYIARDKAGAAAAWVRRITAEFGVIQRTPLLFPFAPEFGPGFRRALVRRYLVLYRTQGDVVRIERVLHGMRDLSQPVD